MTITVTLSQIKKAATSMVGILERTPTIVAPWLGKGRETTVFLKLENLQVTSSFKPRGALIKLLTLSQDECRRGIVAMSAGNHAQGVAYHAQRMGISATIVMPVSTPVAKIERTASYGANIILYGNNLSESAQKANELVTEQGVTLIHPYDDPAIITGQGTVALEMLADAPQIDTLIIPIGGGGLAAGMAIAAKALNPAIKIFGVQSLSCPAMIQALYPERWFLPPDVNVFPLAEGIVVKSPGQLTQEILKEHLHDIIAVSDAHIEKAIALLAIQGKLVAEGAGAAGVAALIANPDLFARKTVGIVICGGNIDTRILSSILMRSLVSDGKLIRIVVELSDNSGSLGRMTKAIGDAGGNIYELIHQRHFAHLTAKMTNVEVTIETRGMEHSRDIVTHLQQEGFPTEFID